MTKVLISDRPRLIPIYEFQHNTVMEKNIAYAINMVNKAISRGDLTIQLDSTKLEHKVHKGTYCYMYNRLGESLSIAYNEEDLKAYKMITGHSRPQHGDKFSRYEGRMNALRYAYSNMHILKEDSNFNDLLTVKRFIGTFELEVNCTSVSYQFMDLWLAVLSNNEESIAEASIKFVGLEAHSDWFAESLLNFSNDIKEYESCEGKLNYVDKYTLFKKYINRLNSSLF